MKSHINWQLFVSLIITITEFFIVLKFFGFFFEESESITSLAIRAGLADSSIPINYNAHVFVINGIFKLQQIFSQLPIYGIYNISLLFIPILIFNYFIISKKNTSISAKIFLVIFIFTLLFDNLVNIHNSRISILLLASFAILIHKCNSYLRFIVSILLLLLACIVRVEYGIIFSFILFIYYLLLKPNIKKYWLYITFSISILFIISLNIHLNQSDEYALTAFVLEREFLEKDNIKRVDTNDPEYQKKITYQKALFYYLEDRKNIHPEDYNNQIKFKSPIDYFYSYQWMSVYVSRLQNLIHLLIKRPIYLYILISSLFISLQWKNRNKRFFYLILIIFPFVIMFQADMAPRFFIPYISGCTIVYLVISREYFKSKRWLAIIVFTCLSLPFIVKGENHLLIMYHRHEKQHEILYSFYKKETQNGKKIVHTHLSQIYYMSPNIFYTLPITPQYFLSISFWHYYDTFRTLRSTIFKDQTNIYSNLKDIENDSNLVLISTDSYMSFLKDYMFYFYHINFIYKPVCSIEDDLNSYQISMENIQSQ